MATATMQTMPTIKIGRSATIAAALTEAPSITIAHSSKFRADIDAGIKARTWRPRRADRYADQNREHQRFKVGVSDEIGFCRFQKHRREGDGSAEKNAWQKALQVIQQWMPRYRPFLESCGLYRE